MVEYVLEDFDEGELSQLKNTFDEGVLLLKEFIKGGVKSLLDANSIMAKEKSAKNLSTDSKSNPEKI